MSATGPVNTIERLLGLVPKIVADAATYCSAAHWFDQELGMAIIEEFLKPNPSATEVFGELTQLPFVYPREDKAWQYTSVARVFLRDQLLRRDGQFAQVSTFLAQYYRADRDTIEDEADLNARQLDWQIAYHLAPEHPDKAIKQLFDLSERAARADRAADIKIITEVCDEQKEWLPSTEVAYLKGQYAYVGKSWQLAEKYLSQVWKTGVENQLMMANTGFMLGVIWRQKGKRVWVQRAESILRRSLTMCDGLLEAQDPRAKELTAQVLNSLAATIVQLGQRRRTEAEAMLDRSLLIGEELHDRAHVGRVYNTQGTLLSHSRNREDLFKAERLYRSSLDIGEELHHQRDVAKVLNSLGQVLVRLGGRHRLQEAEECYRRSLRISERLKDPHSIAQVLQNLGTVLAMHGEKQQQDEAEEHFRRSLQIWQELDNAEGQMRALNSLGQLLTEMGRQTEGEQAIRQAKEIEW